MESTATPSSHPASSDGASLEAQHKSNKCYAPRNLLSVAQFSDQYRAWSQAAIRALILNADGRVNSRGERIPGNGLAEAGAVVRIGRRVLIDEQAFFRWIAEQQGRSKP